MVDRPGACSTFAHELREPLAGTAPEAVGWVLVEDPGPWGREALVDGTLPAAVRQRFEDWPSGVRFQAIRRGPSLAGDRRVVILVHTGHQPWARRFEVDDEELLDLDPEATLHATPPTDGEPHEDPIVLVCTHAKRDACCALLGRPVAAALREALPSITWETSHTGGHRFAPNVVVLPDGAVYGHLELESAVAEVRSHLDGRLVLPRLRGRSGTTRPVQAAELAVRHRLDLDDPERFEVAGAIVEDVDATVLATTWDEDRATGWKVLLHEDELEPRPVSCGAEAKDPGSWRVVALDQM